MSDDLSPESRALLGAARAADDPSPGDRDRVRARMLAAIAAGSATTAGTTAAKAAPATSGLALAKLALILLAAAAVATGAYLVVRGRSGGSGARAEAVQATATAEPPEAGPGTATAEPPEAGPGTATAEPEVVVEIEPEAAPVKRPRKSVRPVEAAPEVVVKPSAADSLKRERALLAKATAALRGGDPDAALAALGEHQHEFPHGVLEEERAASTVLALCATGRTAEGRKARDRFLGAWPRSVHASRVGAACD